MINIRELKKLYDKEKSFLNESFMLLRRETREVKFMSFKKFAKSNFGIFESHPNGTLSKRRLYFDNNDFYYIPLKIELYKKRTICFSKNKFVFQRPGYDDVRRKKFSTIWKYFGEDLGKHLEKEYLRKRICDILNIKDEKESKFTVLDRNIEICQTECGEEKFEIYLGRVSLSAEQLRDIYKILNDQQIEQSI